MAIETICKGCARKLRVGDESAGRKARCPHCKTIYTVPRIAADSSEAFESGEESSDRWLLRTKDGATYGPVPRAELDGWFHEGRLDSASQLQKEGEDAWRRATEIYPSLLPTPVSVANPFASDPASAAPVANPYTSPRAVGRTHRTHRGGLILTLGLLGFVCCQIFSVAAWIMGHADMKEINAGRMDPAGRGLTQAGMIIGIIGTVLMVLGVGAQMLIMAFAVMSEM